MRGTHILGIDPLSGGHSPRLVVEFRHDGPEAMVELVEGPLAPDSRAGRQRTVSLPVAALDQVVPYFERRLGRPAVRPEIETADLTDRYFACLNTMAARERPRELNQVTGLYSCDVFSQVEAWYTDAGLSHEATDQWMPGEMRRIHRRVLLRARPLPGGYNRTLYLEITDGRPGSPARMAFHESYQRAGTDDKACQHTVEVEFSALDAVIAVLHERLGQSVPETDGDPYRRLVTAFEALLERGDLGDHLPYRQNRDRVHTWYASAGMTCRLAGPLPWLHLTDIIRLPGGDALSLQVSSNTSDNRPDITFLQLYFPPGYDGRTIKTEVSTPLASLPVLVEFFEQRLELSAGPGTEDRLFECFTSLVQRGELGVAPGVGRSPQDNAAVVAEWFAIAGVPYEFSGERTYPVLRNHRERTDCLFTLSLTLDTRTVVPTAGAPSARLVALQFTENYEYLPQRGDSGREYAYHAKLAHTPMEPLVDAIERQLGVVQPTPDVDERLVACFQTLVTRGELGDDLPLEANRDRVAALLNAVGAEVVTDFSAWFNSD